MTPNRLLIKETGVIKGRYAYADITDEDVHLFLEKGEYPIESSDEICLVIHYGLGYLVAIEKITIAANLHYVEIINGMN